MWSICSGKKVPSMVLPLAHDSLTHIANMLTRGVQGLRGGLFEEILMTYKPSRFCHLLITATRKHLSRRRTTQAWRRCPAARRWPCATRT